VKEKAQFEKDCCPIEKNGTRLVAHSAKVDLPYVMDLDWFAPEAYSWTLASTAFVLTCAIMTVILRLRGPAWGWDWVNQSMVLFVGTCIAGCFALYADYRAMRWCIVPWLQQVEKLTIMQIKVSFGLFLMLHLCLTVVQVITIQSNAWFMMNAAQTNEEMLHLWVFLWEKSGFHILPKSTWTTLITPKWSAIILWGLSTGQLMLPLLTGVPWPPCKGSHFPTKKARQNHAFVPQEYFHDFMTLWSTLSQEVFEVWGYAVHRCTYRESVAKLSLASGLRYTGSISISYPRHRIDEIIKFKQGYTVKTRTGLETLPQGWEMRAVKECQKLVRTHLNRVLFIMLYKLALQMNLQLTIIIIWRIEDLSKGDIARVDAVGYFSIISLSLTFFMELYDVGTVVSIFCRVRKAVKGEVDNMCNSSKVYATHDFTKDEDKSLQRTIYLGKDLKSEYYMAVRSFWRMIFVTILCVWLIGYALLKFVLSQYCEHGAWSYHQGCLKPPV